MRWISAVGRAVRDGWLILGVCLALLFGINALLDAALGDTAMPTVVDGARHPDKWSAEFLSPTAWVDDYRREFRTSRKLRWEPYVYWRRAAYDGDYININETGIRETWHAANPGSDRLTIWVFGGSTVWGSGARDGHTIPSALARALEHRGYRVDVTNFGERGWVIGQEIAYLQRLLNAGQRPDLALFYDGANDVFASGLQHAHGGPQNEDNRRVEFRSGSNPLQWLRAGLNQMEGLGKLTTRFGKAPVEQPTLDKVAGGIVSRYENSYEQVQALARHFDFIAIMAWQPVIFSRETTSEFERRVVEASLQRHRDLHLLTVEKLRMSQLVTQNRFLDLSSLLDRTSQSVYMDFCHVSEAANETIGNALAARVVETLEDQES